MLLEYYSGFTLNYLTDSSLSNLSTHILREMKTGTQLTFTCSKSTIETLEEGVKYDQN